MPEMLTLVLIVFRLTYIRADQEQGKCHGLLIDIKRT
jgi:hypothetical protein